MGSANSAIVKLWVSYILAGNKNVDDIPEKIKDSVIEELSNH